MSRPLEPGRFFLPGPTEVHPDVLAAQLHPMIGHRGPEMVALMTELQAGLRDVFRTERPVMVSTSSATALMEGAVRGGVARRLLCLVNGAFSQRFADIAARCGIPHDILEVGWGNVVSPGPVADRLASGDFDAVTVVHSETSTGALTPIDQVARAVRQVPGVQLLVDSVTGLGGAPVHTDEWGLDFVLTGSQKALALPPGLAFGAASEDFVARARSQAGRGLYLDVASLHDYALKSQTPQTPAVSLLYATRAQLQRMGAEGMEARWDRHRAMAEATWAWVDWMREERGVEIRVLCGQGIRSPTVTCVTLPATIPGPELVARVREAGWVVGTGYGRLKDRTFRIGHMGDHTLEELEGLLQVLTDVLLEMARGGGR